MKTYTTSAEFEAILTELKELANRVETCRPQTLLISPANRLRQVCRELEGMRRWAERREARENQTSGDEL